MNPITHDCQQGSAEWLELRAKYFTASEASAMMGASKYQTRSALLKAKATGIADEIDAGKQRLFDSGHAAEAAARPIIEAQLGEELFPVTMSVEIDGLPLLASLDGITMMGDIIWENKLLSASLKDAVDNGELSLHYAYQIEQQMLVSGATKAYFTTSDGTESGTFGMWYESDPELAMKLIAGWKQFAIDLAAYAPSDTKEMPKAEVTIDLPTLFVHAKGEITTNNMDEFGKALAAKLAETRAIVLVTDHDFSNAKSAAAKFRDTAKAIALSKAQMLAQTETIGEAALKMDAWAKDLNTTALQLEKDVEREDKAKKESMVLAGKNKYTEHIAGLEAEISPIRMNLVAPNFAEAIKGKRNYASMQDAVDTMLAGAKVTADGVAKDIRSKLAWCKEHASGHSALFPDLQQIIVKPMDDFTLVITSRIEKSKADEAARLEAERERIRAEEQERANREAAAKLEQERAAQVAEINRVEQERKESEKLSAANQPQHAQLASSVEEKPKSETQPALSIVSEIQAPADACLPTIKLGEICARLGFTVSAEFLASLGVEATTEKNAKLYPATKFPTICRLISEHVMAVAFKKAA